MSEFTDKVYRGSKDFHSADRSVDWTADKVFGFKT